MSTTSNPRAPQPGEAHHLFYAHLLEGGKVYRDDPLNGVKEVLSLESLEGNAAKVIYYGYRNLELMHTYQISYVGNDGLEREMEFEGTQSQLEAHITALEEHGCHSFSAYAPSGSCVYADGAPTAG